MSRKTRKIMNGQYKFKGKKGSEKKKNSPLKNCSVIAAMHPPNTKKIKFFASLLLLNLIIIKTILVKR
jgi:hypothetical protein